MNCTNKQQETAECEKRGCQFCYYDEEIWKDIPGYNGEYQISSWGRVKSFKKNKETIMKPHMLYSKYYQIFLYKNRKTKGVLIHRLVATVFIPNPENKPEVNHKDGDKTNNHLSNLEWCTHRENIKHAWATGLEKNTVKRILCGKKYAKLNFKNGEHLRKKVDQYDLKGNFIKTWESGTEAERQLNLPHSKVAACCVGKRKTTGGYIWRHHRGIVKTEKN